MDNMSEFKNWWETNRFLLNEEIEIDCSYFEEPFSGYYDSSSPDGTQSPASKNIVSERNRRKKLNDRLFALRAVVPKITKMDKASIIKDAIEYIQSLQEEERRLHGEISELENGRQVPAGIFEFDPEVSTVNSKLKRTRMDHNCNGFAASRSIPFSPIEVLELKVSTLGDKILLVNLVCSKRRDTMVKLCEIFEALNLKIITALITASSGRLSKTVFIEADEEDKDVLRLKIERAIVASNNDADSPMSS